MARRNAARIRRLYGLEPGLIDKNKNEDHPVLVQGLSLSPKGQQQQQPVEFLKCKRTHAEEVLILTAQVSELRQQYVDEADQRSIVEMALVNEQKQVQEVQEALNIMCQTSDGENAKLVRELRDEIEALKEELSMERKRADDADIDAADAVQLTYLCVKEKERVEGELQQAWMEIERLQLEFQQRAEYYHLNYKEESQGPLNDNNVESLRINGVQNEILDSNTGHEFAPQSINEDGNLMKKVAHVNAKIPPPPPKNLNENHMNGTHDSMHVESSPTAMLPPPPRPPKISPYERETTEDSVIGHSFVEDDETSACRMFHGGVESAPTSPIQQRRIWPDENDNRGVNLLSPISVETRGSTISTVLNFEDKSSRPTRAMVSSGRNILKKFKRISASK